MIITLVMPVTKLFIVYLYGIVTNIVAYRNFSVLYKLFEVTSFLYQATPAHRQSTTGLKNEWG